MASALATGASGIFNAVAFSAAGFLFSKLNKSGYTAEIKRHDKALEQLQRDRDHWNQARLDELDRISKLHYDRDQADKDIYSTDKDLDLVKKLNLVKEQYSKTEPKLEDYYTPSKIFQDYMTAVKFLATIPVLYTIVTYL